MRFKLILMMLGVTYLFITINSCTTPTPPIKEYIYVPVKDTIGEKNNIEKIVRLQHELELTRDSLNKIKDSLGTDLFVANYKLARIKEYNRIAGQRNNIKYLRGWINRVLKDDN
jgi:hypothetical protein